MKEHEEIKQKSKDWTGYDSYAFNEAFKIVKAIGYPNDQIHVEINKLLEQWKKENTTN